MIEKMQFVSITGPKADIDRVVDQYLSRYEIHLENALAQLQTLKTLTPYLQINPYKGLLAKALEYEKLLDSGNIQTNLTMTLDEAVALIESFDQQLTRINEQKKELEDQKKELEELLTQLEPFLSLDFDISRFLQFRYMTCRFGRISREYYNKFETYVYGSEETLFYPCQKNDRYIWGFYFCPTKVTDRIDAVYASMHFEQLDVPEKLYGIPSQVQAQLAGQLQQTEKELAKLQDTIAELLQKQGEKLYAATRKLESQSRNFDVRRLAACTKEDNREVFYILCGWMSVTDATAFQKEIADDQNLYCFVETDPYSTAHGEPPTKLKNPKIFRPFEMFVKMYGLPSYHEMDPTIFVALTYMFIFGAMFGDAGQGACLVIGGFLLYKFKKLDLAAIIGTAGIFSTFFGLMFGSIFGFEDIIDAIWLRPQEAMTDLPFIGRLNTVFVVAIAIGMGIILLCMILNIINSARVHDTEKLWFDTNGAAGLVFYAALASVIVLYMSGKALPATIVLVIMFVIPLAVIFFKEPLTAMVEKKSEKISGGVGMFITQGIFELFEVLLSYFSNTLSFVRVGAFAVSHAAMMQVVLMLAGAEAGDPNWGIVIGGNLFVCGMEGLIVGIQVLRLEYYELFSRFYRGSGRAFEPYGR